MTPHVLFGLHLSDTVPAETAHLLKVMFAIHCVQAHTLAWMARGIASVQPTPDQVAPFVEPILAVIAFEYPGSNPEMRPVVAGRPASGPAS